MKDALRQTLQTKADSIAPGVPVCWLGQQEPAKADAFGRWSVILGDTKPATVGASMTRTLGILTLQIMTREGAGTKAAHDAADACSTALRNWQTHFTAAGTGTITFNEVSGPSHTGASAGYLTHNITAPFYVDFQPTA